MANYREKGPNLANIIFNTGYGDDNRSQEEIAKTNAALRRQRESHNIGPGDDFIGVPGGMTEYEQLVADANNPSLQETNPGRFNWLNFGRWGDSLKETLGLNAKNVKMNQNDNIENGIGIENPLEIAANNQFGQGQGGDEGIDWLNMGRWGESLGQSVQDLPGNIKGMLGRLWNSGGAGGGEEESQEVPAIEESLYFNEDIMGG